MRLGSGLLLVCMFALLVTGSLGCAGSPGRFTQKAEKPKKKILMFSQSLGWRHSVVARPLTGELSHAEKVLKEFATKAGYEVCFSQDYHDLQQEEQIKEFDVIILYATGEPAINQDAFLKWLRAGGALVGIHTATDSYYNWPKYGQIIGAYFEHHGCKEKEVTIKVENTAHPSTKMLPPEWVLCDEIYQFKAGSFSREHVKTLLSVDTSKMSAEQLKCHKMESGKDYPIAWTNTEGKGRIFYTSLGHREDVWTNPKFQEHVLGGMAWALGEAK